MGGCECGCEWAPWRLGGCTGAMCFCSSSDILHCCALFSTIQQLLPRSSWNTRLLRSVHGLAHAHTLKQGVDITLWQPPATDTVHGSSGKDDKAHRGKKSNKKEFVIFSGGKLELMKAQVRAGMCASSEGAFLAPSLHKPPPLPACGSRYYKCTRTPVRLTPERRYQEPIQNCRQHAHMCIQRG